jgi:hypothetical protein
MQKTRAGFRYSAEGQRIYKINIHRKECLASYSDANFTIMQPSESCTVRLIVRLLLFLYAFSLKNHWQALIPGILYYKRSLSAASINKKECSVS